MNPDAIQDGGPAFPCEVGSATNGYTFQTAKEQWSQPGMTMRDYFAAKVIQGRMAGGARWQELDFKPVNGLDVIQNECVLAYRIADAMLAAGRAA